MSNASIMLGFTRNAIKVFLVLCLLHTWTKATPILRTEARKDIHQKTEPLGELAQLSLSLCPAFLSSKISNHIILLKMLLVFI
ncbi:hypothetical protein KP509_25G021600 [Ceratopteris richardii]|uniref:Secreted protein n=1 Tax=Ceratopteris richardii TaxID=49495 RepID=A0A8T2RR97_CERRI|nr:hypothetical protein KP509_25G021600 [Ceratopteris richardii]